MSIRRTLLVTTLVTLLVAASGCSALQGGSNVDAQQVLDRTQEGMSDLESVTFDAQMTMSPQQADQSQNLSATGAVDISSGEARAEVDGPAQSLTIYFVNETMYMNLQGTWIKQSVPNATADVQPTTTPQEGQFSNVSSVSFEGNTTIDGTDVYELAVDVDEEQIQNALEQQGQGMASMYSFEDVSYTVYVTHEDYRLKRLNGDMSMTFQGQSVDTDMEITLSDFNEDVSIELPSGAENAESATVG